MHKVIILLFLLISIVASAQETNSFQAVDSISYQCYLIGNWDKLIEVGKQAINDKIDYKYLRQRMGYAYFAKGDYYASEQQYEKALEFDKSDAETNSYLYHCSLYSGNATGAQYRSRMLTDEQKNRLKIKPFHIINAVDLEYNYKSNNVTTRSNPNYIRAGINTQLGYDLSLYQAFSTYGQQNNASFSETAVSILTQSIDTTAIRQNEYFASLKWAVTPHLTFSAGYHYLQSTLRNQNIYSYKSGNSDAVKTLKDTTTILPGNMFFSSMSYSINRFEVGLNGSAFNYNNVWTQQYGIYAGVTLPGTMSLQLKSSLNLKIDANSSRLVFSQSAGAILLKNLWLEGKLTLGNLNNYTDNNGLYVYNSIDPTVFRTGLTMFWNITPAISLVGNYTFDNKRINETNTNYYQHSFSGGIIWKI